MSHFPMLYAFGIALEIDPIPYPTPMGLEFGKHDLSVQIWTFHSITRINIVLEIDPHPCTPPHGVKAAKHDFYVWIWTFH